MFNFVVMNSYALRRRIINLKTDIMMKTRLRIAVALMLMLSGMGVEAKVAHILPKPQQVTMLDERPFALWRPVKIFDSTNCAYLRHVFEDNGCVVASWAKATVRVNIVDSIKGSFHHNVPGFADEAYELYITRNEVEIRAITQLGVIRAAQTIQQMAEGYTAKAKLEAVNIVDWPAFAVRGLMHDVGRSFIPFDELKREIDLLARFKLSVFHWHLTEHLAWRMEVEKFPQLTQGKYMIRDTAQYYTRLQCRELEAYAAQRGITVIPEIDMPGHSDAFKRAMGMDMQSDEGIDSLKVIIDEVVENFPLAPYIHIGGDEVNIHYPDFLKIMAQYVRSKGKKVLMWNRLSAGAPTAEICDMTQMWATAGKAVKGLPNIDCRYNYINHFDVYADLAGIYRSNIYYEQRGTDDVAGTITAVWNDTKTQSWRDIVRQNNLYANVLASAERAWCGGGKQYIEQGGTGLGENDDEAVEFADFERRFLFHKANSLSREPISYVRQSNVHWRITEPMPNGGNADKVFPPETCTDEVLPESFVVDGVTYGTRLATGAGIYLRHIWHPIVPSFLDNPQKGHTVYAWTYVYSPRAQKVGAQIEFYTYSRSGNEVAPKAGCWDRRGSRIWLNDKEIPAPQWAQPDATIKQDQGTTGLTNENLTARPMTHIKLRRGWNKVLMRLPYADNGGTGRDKWQFTFVITDTKGENALEGIVYSPTRSF